MVIVSIIAMLLSLGLSFLVFSGLTWVFCWALVTAGIVAVAWTWKLAFCVWLIYLVLKTIIKGLFNNN